MSLHEILAASLRHGIDQKVSEALLKDLDRQLLELDHGRRAADCGHSRTRKSRVCCLDGSLRTFRNLKRKNVNRKKKQCVDE